MYEQDFALILAQESDLCHISNLEAESYPEDESASPATIAWRAQVAPEYMYVLLCLSSNLIVGFVNGTCVDDESISHSSMSSHVVGAKNLVIHSVVIDQNYRRKGIGQYMLKAYIEKMRKVSSLWKISLLAKRELVKFYRSCGFSLDEISNVAHGKVYPSSDSSKNITNLVVDRIFGMKCR